MNNEPKPRKKSSVRHTRAVQRARTTRQNAAPPADQITERLTEVVHPATLLQVDAFHHLGLRERLLTLSIMMAFVVSLIWRQLGSVCEAVRVLQREGMLWNTPLQVKNVLEHPVAGVAASRRAAPQCSVVLESEW